MVPCIGTIALIEHSSENQTSCTYLPNSKICHMHMPAENANGPCRFYARREFLHANSMCNDVTLFIRAVTALSMRHYVSLTMLHSHPCKEHACPQPIMMAKLFIPTDCRFQHGRSC